ncbi:hypothetical protein [Rossellomorea marisflavi]|uniref:hypothetical protein n=1 Tax=Rossellomorea marisflavi TaxID=189381 RepID=UPI0009A8B6CA|nr:hypothetical protein [Rossellomorea marisflavi]
MKSVVKKISEQQAIIEFHTNTGTKVLEINATNYGYTHEDFTDWDISDEEYYTMEDVVSRIADAMGSEDELIYDIE